MSEATLDLKKEDDREPLLSSTDFDARDTYADTYAISSDHTTVKSKEGKEKKVILGMVVKKDTTIWKIIAMAIFPGLLAAIVSFLNAMEPLVLQSEDFYGIDKSELGSRTAESNQYGQAAVVLMLPFIAIFVDLSSRKVSVGLCMILCTLLTWSVPILAPNFAALCCARTIIAICTVVVYSIPFGADYIKKESRGLGQCLSGVCFGLFQVINFLVCIPYSKTVSYYESFTLISMAVLIISVICLLMLGTKNRRFDDA